jgi:outer membrane protein assembly factor BamB
MIRVMVRVWALAFPSLFLLTLLAGPAGAEPGDILWTTQRGARIDDSPAWAGNGAVYIGSDDNFLYAIDGGDGAEIWRFETGADVFSSPAVGADGTIYVGSDDGFLYAVTPDGDQRWRFDAGDLVRSSPAIGPDGTVYVGANDGNVYAVDGEDGALRWFFSTDGAVFSCPSIDDAGTVDDLSDDTVYFGSDDGNVYAVGADGALRWFFETEGVVRSSPAVGADGTVYIGSDDRRLYALETQADGRVRRRWAFESGGAIRASAALAEDGTLYIGALDGFLYALRSAADAAERLRWSFDAGGAIHSSAAVGSDGNVYFGAQNAFLFALEPDGELEWSVRINETLSSPLVDPEGTLYIGSGSDGSAATLGGRLYAVETGAAGLDDDSPWPKFGHDIRQTGRNSENQGPTAEAGPDQTVVDGESVLLDGAGSTDPDYGISDYQWRQTRGSAVEFTEAGRAEARFVAPGDPDDTTLAFELTVTDIGGLRATDTVSIAVEEDDAFCFLTAVQAEWPTGKTSPATLVVFLAMSGCAWIRRRAK